MPIDVVDYKRENVAERIHAVMGGRGLDAVIEMDLAANAKLLPGIVAPRARVVVYGTGQPTAEIPSQFLLVNAVAIKFVFVYELTPAERAAAISAITEMTASRRLIHNLAATFALDDIIAAHEAVEQGKAAGNVVVTIA